MKKELFDELVSSIKEMGAVRRGEAKAARTYTAADVVTTPAGIAAIRKRMRLSQSKFAALLGISVDTLQNWEQGRVSPTGPAQKLLRIAALRPDVLLELAS